MGKAVCNARLGRTWQPPLGKVLVLLRRDPLRHDYSLPSQRSESQTYAVHLRINSMLWSHLEQLTELDCSLPSSRLEIEYVKAALHRQAKVWIEETPDLSLDGPNRMLVE